MARGPQIKLHGLYTYANPLSEVPSGALSIADNIVIDADGAAQSRRGFDLLGPLPLTTDRANKLFTYSGSMLAHYSANKLAYFDPNAAVWNPYSGSYPPIDATTCKTRAVEANSNFYFTTANGIYKLDALTNTPVAAGAPKGLDLNAALNAASSGFLINNTVLTTTGNTTNASTAVASVASTAGIAIGMYISGTGIPTGTTVTAFTSTTITLSQNATATNTSVALSVYQGSQVAYRVVFGYKDANTNLILGVPSQRFVIANTSSTSKNVDLTFTVPATVTTNYLYQVYRSPISVNATTEPSDEMQLVFEGNPTSGQISAKQITLTDSTPDSLKSAYLYTSSSQEGILQANEPPPEAKDIAFFRGYVLYANTTSKQRLNLTVLAAGGSAGVAVGDVLTIGGVAYTGANTENVATNSFQVVTTGTPAQNITNTVNSLIRVINQSASNTTYYAYYLSGYNDLPGKILIEARLPGASAIAATASAHGTAYSPALPTSGVTVVSAPDVYKNGLYISKAGEPEAVPLTNQFFVGSAAFEIKRVVPLRDSVFIFKDDGIYKLIGQTFSNFYVDLFDNTTKLLAPDSAVSLNNTIYCLSNQGVVSVSDTGISVISRQIEGDILNLFGANLDSVSNLSYGISYNSDRKYILGIISSATDTVPTQFYVYNLFTNAWTRWSLSKSCGVVNPVDGKLYLGDAKTSAINIERKDYSYTDYTDQQYNVNITAINGTVITLDNLTNVQVGDILFQTSAIRSVVASINLSSNTVVVQDLVSWTLGNANILSAITCVIQFQPQTGEGPQELTQFSELELFFKRARFNAATLSFYSDVSQSSDSLTIMGLNNGGWSFFPWGSVPFGGTLLPTPIRTYIPRDKQRCTQLNIKFTHRVGYGDFYLEGINLKSRAISSRVAR